MHHHRGNPPLLSFPGSEASMVYTLISGPIVNTFFPCSPKDMVYTIAFRCRVTDPAKRSGTLVVYTPFLSLA